jgi:RNA polymerase sigma factor (sigma-70 family)
MARYTFETATEKITIQVSHEWKQHLDHWDKDEYNLIHGDERTDKKYKTRVNISLDFFADTDDTTNGQVLKVQEEIASPSAEQEFFAALDELHKHELIQRLKECIPQLPPRQMDIIKRVYLDGISQSQYAAENNINRCSVSELHKNAILKLRELMGNINE